MDTEMAADSDDHGLMREAPENISRLNTGDDHNIPLVDPTNVAQHNPNGDSQPDEPHETIPHSPREKHLPSATADAMATYGNIQANVYIGSATGKSIAEESMPCECKYDPDVDHPNAACGDDNYCINRMMFMECVADDCPCERYCRNRRFQLRQYSRVDVIRTEKKGFGLRALTDLPSNAFIMEYVGEVIPNQEFIRRTRVYEAEGLKHYYFMTLKTDEIIDATKKGCLARFINHSCSPNSVTQKWVVGKTMRIGIFTRCAVKAGSELTFDYKFERYGSVAQKCFCGEPTCKGYIGGSAKDDTAVSTVKRKVDRDDTAEDESESSDEGSDSDTTKAVTLTQKNMIRHMQHRVPEPLRNPDSVQSFMKKMLDSVGKKHLVSKLLLRLELTIPSTSEGREVLRKFVRLHGLKMLKFWLREWKNDMSIVKKIMLVLEQLPLANRNGLEDCQMFDIIGRFTKSSDEDIQTLATSLIDTWSQLKTVYRIPKRPYVETKVENTETTDKRDETTAEDDVPVAKHPRFDSTREFFDPDDDYFEYISIQDDASQIYMKLLYPPQSIAVMPQSTIPVEFDPSGAHDSYGFYQSSDAFVSVPQEAASTSQTQTPDMYATMDIKPEQYTYTNPVPDIPTGPQLPPNWKSATSEDGAIYYYNVLTRQTQWEIPEERISSVEGVDRSQIKSLVERAMLDTKRKRESTKSASPSNSVGSRPGRSPRVSTPSSSRSVPTDVPAAGRGKERTLDKGIDDAELKKEIGRVVTKYLTVKHKALWKGDKTLFKDLARKITHHVIERETHSTRKIHAVDSTIRAKIEKLIDSHGHEFVQKLQRKNKQRAVM